MNAVDRHVEFALPGSESGQGPGGIWSTLGPAVMKRVLDFGDWRHIRAGTRICEPRLEPVEELGFLLTGVGSFRLVSEPHVASLVLHPGDCWGEHTLFRGRIGAFDLVADADCDVVVLRGAQAWSLMEEVPGVALQLARLNASRTDELARSSLASARRQFRPHALEHLDPVTGAANQERMGSIYERQMRRSSRAGSPSSIAVFRISNLDDIRDHMGESAADDAMAALSKVIDRVCRPTDIKARSGEVSLAVLLVGTSDESGSAVVKRVREAFYSAEVMGPNHMPMPLMLAAELLDLHGSEQAEGIVRQLRAVG
jgi:diguanylate cyclase (GGDEF)-like protein